MHIFFWFLILAVITLAINIALIIFMGKRGKFHCFPILSVLMAGYILSGLLYAISWSGGIRILSQTMACTMPIETASYRSATQDGITSYAFCSEDGITFRLDETELLDAQVPQTPSTVEVYYCQVRTGLPWCYLNDGTAVKYILK
jgi:hypothetical protein